MHLPLALLAASAFPLSALARPSSLLTSRTDCGDSRKFYDATPEKWDAANTDEWLDNWWKKHQSDITRDGFAKAFGVAALDLPLSCRFSGEDGNCVTVDSTCSNRRFGALTPSDQEPAYYVLTSLRKLHGYIQGYQHAVQASGILASFDNDYMTTLFYQDPSTTDPTWLKEMINWLVVILSIGASGLGIANKAGPITSGVIGAGTTMAGGAQTEAFLRLAVDPPDLYGSSAITGHAMAQALKTTFTALFSLNDKLMAGQSIASVVGQDMWDTTMEPHNYGDLREFFKHGKWVNAPELNMVAGMDAIGGVLASIQINTSWRQQPIFIMGGIPCDNTELGPTPKDQEGISGWCDPDTNKAWYFYTYMTKGPKVWLDRPWGSDRLGKDSLFEQKYGDKKKNEEDKIAQFGFVEVADVIRSSLKSFSVAGNTYNYGTFSNRMADIMADGNAPLSEKSSLEGLWTIPVCDVSAYLDSDDQNKQKILLDYGDTNPHWCGNICGDKKTTKEFLEAAHLNERGDYNFDLYCDPQGYA